MSRLDFERVYPHDRARVWRALTESDLLARWLMPNDFVAKIGHSFQFRTDPAPGFDGIVNCEVLAIDEPDMLSFSWRGGPIDTVVTFHLDTVEGGTRLRFEQTGFKGFKQWLVRTMLKAGFGSMYSKKLPRLLDELASGGGAPAPADPKACGGPFHRIRFGLLHLFGRSSQKDNSPPDTSREGP